MAIALPTFDCMKSSQRHLTQTLPSINRPTDELPIPAYTAGRDFPFNLPPTEYHYANARDAHFPDMHCIISLSLSAVYSSICQKTFPKKQTLEGRKYDFAVIIAPSYIHFPYLHISS